MFDKQYIFSQNFSVGREFFLSPTLNIIQSLYFTIEGLILIYRVFCILLLILQFTYLFLLKTVLKYHIKIVVIYIPFLYT
mgnify:CR=1 FL=1